MYLSKASLPSKQIAKILWQDQVLHHLHMPPRPTEYAIYHYHMNMPVVHTRARLQYAGKYLKDLAVHKSSEMQE